MKQAEPLLIHTESSLAWGGQEIRIFTELKRLPEYGWKIQLWAPEESEIHRRAKTERIVVETVPFSGTFDAASILRVRALVKALGPNIVVTHSSIDSWVVGLATRCMTRRPRLVRARHLSTPVKNFLSYRWFPDAISTTSTAIRQGLIAKGIPETKIRALPTGVDLSRFRPNPSAKPEMRKKYGLPEKDFLAGGVFVIRSWKGIQDFVKIISDVPTAFFVVAGDGPSREAMVRAAENLGVLHRIKFLGHVEAVEEIFWALDAFLFPSTANEGVPQALLQAQACGVPAVTSDLASIREAAPHAVLCAPGDVKSFSQSIQKLIADQTFSRTVSDEGLKWVKRFDQTEVLKGIDRFYRELI